MSAAKLYLSLLIVMLLPVSAGSPARLMAGESNKPSIYQLEMALTDQAGRKLGLDVFRGRPVIISMFYATCPQACPLLIGDIQRLEKSLDPASRSRIRVLLVSLDPERDTPERLKTVADAHGLDPTRWRLTTAPEGQVRDLAAVLGVKYRFLTNGMINHSSIITVLDPVGAIDARMEGLQQPQAQLTERLRVLAGEAP